MSDTAAKFLAIRTAVLKKHAKTCAAHDHILERYRAFYKMDPTKIDPSLKYPIVWIDEDQILGSTDEKGNLIIKVIFQCCDCHVQDILEIPVREIDESRFLNPPMPPKNK